MDIESFNQVIIQEFLNWQPNESNINDTDFYKKRLHHFRTIFEPYVYHILIKKYGDLLDKKWQDYIPPLESDKAFVIIERRCHHNYWFILRNIAWANPNMSVYIICSDENELFIRSLLGSKASNFHILPLFKGSPNRATAIKDYNNLLTDYTFYEKINAKYILTIQMDVFIRKKITDDLFIGDYWGAPWAWTQIMPGGSGATIRNVQKMIELCKLYRPNRGLKQSNPSGKAQLTFGKAQLTFGKAQLTFGKEEEIHGEDAWFSSKIIELGWKYPDIDFRKRTIMESIPTADPCIVHQFWTYFEVFKNHFHTELFHNFLYSTFTIQI